MRSLILLILIISSSAVFCQKKLDQVNVVIENMKVQELAWNNADISGFMKYYWKSDSLKFIGSKGITYGWQKTLDNYLKSYPTKEAMGTLTFQIVECTKLSNSCIYVIGKWDLKKEKSVGGHFTLLWKKINDNWFIVADHTS